MVNRKDLRTISPGEFLWLERRARKQTQAEAAKRYGVSERKYNALERDLVDASSYLANIHRDPESRARTCKMLNGHCALARRRDGRPLRDLAKLLGAGTHVTLLAWERGADPRLVKAWEKRGYIFGNYLVDSTADRK